MYVELNLALQFWTGFEGTCPLSRKSHNPSTAVPVLKRVLAATIEVAYSMQKHFANVILNFMRQVVPKQWRNFRDQVTDNCRIISHRNVRVLQ
ncbi:hypothetical protein RC74_15965 [Falsihalocynthiibacter arcticus]|uniref:Uncharacterized protein n=1 Tax=Falsihalocynthiibacter arcticus TaxID=1579316 RepID=A0A126V3P2_9RHOB|nr:hypothetical protein RC74_15965 [Falsihalocynthiibacter arcticus]